MKTVLNIWLVAAALALQPETARADYRDLGYLYLSPVPDAEFTSRSTKFILVRFKEVTPASVTNLDTFVTVTGAKSGRHTGRATVASDGRTVIYTLDRPFQSEEMVTVSLKPRVGPGGQGTVSPFRYRFATSGPMPPPPILSARGEASPETAAGFGFDDDPSTHWSDPALPEGGQPSWIQLMYPGTQTRVVNTYTITASGEAASAPSAWRFYGIDRSTNRVLLDFQEDRVFPGPSGAITCTTTNVLGFRGYRLEVLAVSEPAQASSVQIAELSLAEPQGGLLREYWMNIPGKWVNDLTNSSRFPDAPDGSDLLPSLEGPTDWADNYGARISGFLTAPEEGDYVFWVSGDETCELWLSTSSEPAQKRRIARLLDWTQPRQWAKYFFQKSDPVRLAAGERYYIEVLYKEGLGYDSLAIGWAKPGESTDAPSELVPGSVLTPQTDGLTQPAKLLAVTATPGPGIPQPLALEESPPRPAPAKASARILSNGVSVPSDFPAVIITVNSNPAPGYLFLENAGQNGSRFTMILDNSGAPVWYRRGEGRDFKVQRDGSLSWGRAFTGLTWPFTGMDQNFVWTREYRAVNGFGTDEHELKVLPGGGYLLLGAAGEMADLRPYVARGQRDAYVWQTALQEFTAAGELIFQFRAWDHFRIADSDPVVEPPWAFGVRFSHMNAIDVDEDGHLLISSRHLNEITKINRDTGEVTWRLGGTNSHFTFVNDPLNGFKAQHDIASLGGNRYLLFDNGNGHKPQVSRAVEYELDLDRKTATLTWEFRDIPDKYTHFMASAQRLPNGHTLINFALGEYPKVTEVDRAGTKRFVMNLQPHTDLYRAFRFPWNGVVPTPYLELEPRTDGVTLLFNKFGDATVDHYRVYGGTSPAPTNLLATSRTTLKRLITVVNGARNYFRVTAVSTNGVESGFSNEESLLVNIVAPGENVLTNPDFDLGTNGWGLVVATGATASWTTDDGAACVAVDNGGTAPADVRLQQAAIKLVQGEEYVLEFDAWSEMPRLLEVRLGSVTTAAADYSGWTPVLVTPVRNRFRLTFRMSAASDLNAVLRFGAGASAADIFVDNISLVLRAFKPGDANRDGTVSLPDLQRLANEWLKKGDFASDWNGDGKVDFHDFGILGNNWSW